MILNEHNEILDMEEDLSIPYYAFCLCIIGCIDGYYPSVEEALEYIQGINSKTKQNSNKTQSPSKIVGVQLSF